MQKSNNLLVLLSGWVLVGYPSASLAQLPPRIETPKPEETPLPEPPREPELDIIPAPKLPGIDNFPDLVVKNFEFVGNTVIRNNELQSVVEPYIGKTIGMRELRLIRDELTKLYFDRGYITTGVSIPLKENTPLNLADAHIKIIIMEGQLETVKVNGSGRLARYVRSRLVSKNEIFNSNKTQERLRFLGEDPLVKQINGRLLPADALNRSILEIELKPSPPYKVELFADNYRNRNVGTSQRGVDATIRNPLTLGDTLNFRYSNSNGSDTLQASYIIPATKNTAFSFSYGYGKNTVIAQPVDILDIGGTSQSYTLGVRHSIFRRATSKNRWDVGIGLNLQHLQSQDKLLGFNFPVARGSNNEGLTQISVLSFLADASFRDTNQVASLRSDIRIGVDIGSETGPGFDDGQFFSWRGEGAWARRLPWELLFTSRIGLQFADRPLVASEQLSLGGINTIPGYPQDSYLSDNGIYGGIGLSKAIDFGKYGRLTIGPFFNIGYGWGNGEFDEPARLIAAPGILVGYAFNQSLFFDLSYGIPLFNADGERNNLQSDGLFLSLRYVF
jgi:hemolysin activation/secretion protein